MRILIANDGFGDAGGVQSYLDAVIAGLGARGHYLAMLHRDPTAAAGISPAASLLQFSAAEHGVAGAVRLARQWGADVCFSHNMNVLEIDRQLIDAMPVTKFMHGYWGTCVGSQKRMAFPVAQPCDRVFGAPCLALYLPRHCCQLSPVKMVEHYRWATEQHHLLNRYRAIVVASDHMKREYVRHGVDPNGVHVNPLFPTNHTGVVEHPGSPSAPTVAFMGRMTLLKGGDLLIRAVAEASRRLGTAIRLTMIGDGPQRPAWERLASALQVPATFVGWRSGDERWPWVHRASLLAVPSTWPEPFGLVGLEASALGVPAIAFDVGGIRQWLRPGQNGYLIQGDPPRASAFADGLVSAFGHPDELAAMRRSAVRVAREMTLERHLDRLERILAGEAFSHANSAGR